MGWPIWARWRRVGAVRPSIPQETIDQIVELTLHSQAGGGHALVVPVDGGQGRASSTATVQRVWDARGLKPHLVETFKLSNDKRFEEKLVDVVGLYLNPPDKAVVLCMDEKSQIQALDRTQPSLPLKPGRAGTMTHDYKRHGTTTLFAALDVLTGKVIGKCFARHRHDEFLRFLRTIDTAVPRKLQIHLIVDNYGTHTHPNVKAWLAKHPALPPALHPDQLVVAEHGRTLVRRTDRQDDPPRRVPQRRRPRRRDRGVPARTQRRPETVRVDRDRRIDPGQGPTWTRHPPASG